MIWKCYLTIFKAESPIHIGYRQVGILKTTRYYITGRAIWGAITANLTRALFDNPSPEDYQAVGNFVKDNIKTTYFYPAIEKDKVENLNELSKVEVNNYLVFLPEYAEEGLKFGELGKEKFEQIFVGSFVSTAIDVTSKTAEEGSLHEFEFIKNKVRIGKSSVDVYWVGYIFVNCNETKAKSCEGKKERKEYNVKISEENCDIKITFKNKEVESNVSFKKEVLNILFVGGERNYGLGKLELLSGFPKRTENKVFDKFEFKAPDEKITFENLNLAISHIKLDKAELLERGEIEPLVGLEWNEKGAGQKISNTEICIAPGSIFKSEIPCYINDYGILKINSET